MKSQLHDNQENVMITADDDRHDEQKQSLPRIQLSGASFDYVISCSDPRIKIEVFL
jgi:hypothetical protein